MVTTGEPLPDSKSTSRLWRGGLLARELASRGHHVTWWTSGFDHVSKRRIEEGRRDKTFFDRVVVRYLDGSDYRKNVSLNRMVNHFQIAQQFLREASREPPPDVIFSSFPTIELSWVAARLAKRYGVSLVVDIRDLWPDIFVSAVPRPLQPLARLVLQPYFSMARQALAGATSLMAVSSEYCDWACARAGRVRGAFDAVCPLGYERHKARAELQALLSRMPALDFTKPVAIFAGSFGQTYDLETVIAAAKLLHRDASTIQFVLCGSGEQEARWRELAQGAPNVWMPGLLPAAELATLMSNSTIGLAAYVSGAPQGIPNKVIEYLSANLPIASSLAGETKELLAKQNCGLTYAANNPRDLAQQLATLAANPALIGTMASNAKDIFAKSFDASVVYPLMASHIERVANMQAGNKHGK